MYWARSKISSENWDAADFKKAIVELFEFPTHIKTQTEALETIRAFSPTVSQPALRELVFAKGLNGSEPLTSDTQKRNFEITQRHSYLNYRGLRIGYNPMQHRTRDSITEEQGVAL